MYITAIKVLGTLHGIIALLNAQAALKTFALQANERLPRARILFVASKTAFSSCMLMFCVIAAWILLRWAWVFAALSLLSYVPAPHWARPIAATAPSLPSLSTHIRHLVPYAIATRVAGVVLLAFAAYGVAG